MSCGILFWGVLMELPTWLTKTILFASILTAVISPLAGIKPIYGIIATAAAGLINAFANGFVNFVLPKGFTVAGIALVAAGILAYIAAPDNASVFGGVISAHTLTILAQLGVILATVGKKLQEPEPVAPRMGGLN